MNSALMNQSPLQHNVQPVPGTVGQHELSQLPAAALPEQASSSAEQAASTHQQLGSVGVKQAIGNYVPGVGNVIGDQPVDERRWRGIAAAEESPRRRDIYDHTTREPSEAEKGLIEKHLNGGDTQTATEAPQPATTAKQAAVRPVAAQPTAKPPSSTQPTAGHNPAQTGPYRMAPENTGPRSLAEIEAIARKNNIEVD